MFDKLDFITEKYQELSEKVADPAIISDQKTWQKYMKEMAEIEPIVKSYESYRKMQSDLADAREIIDMEDDEEMRELAKEEAKELEEQMEKAQEELKILLLPKDPNDDKNVILEIRAGTGGEEAALFGNDLLRLGGSHRLLHFPAVFIHHTDKHGLLQHTELHAGIVLNFPLEGLGKLGKNVGGCLRQPSGGPTMHPSQGGGTTADAAGIRNARRGRASADAGRNLRI